MTVEIDREQITIRYTHDYDISEVHMSVAEAILYLSDFLGIPITQASKLITLALEDNEDGSS